MEENKQYLKTILDVKASLQDDEDDRDDVVFVSPLLCAQHNKIEARVVLEKSERDAAMEAARVKRQAK